MPRRLRPEQQLELDALYRVVAVIADWYDGLVSAELGQMGAAVRRVYDARDLRGMRMAYNDVVEMTSAADTEQRRDLDARLRAAANTTLATIDGKTAQRIDRILSRGRITSEEQYYVVREHIEFNRDSADGSAAVQRLFAMLQDFETRWAARSRRRGSSAGPDLPPE